MDIDALLEAFQGNISYSINKLFISVRGFDICFAASNKKSVTLLFANYVTHVNVTVT